MKTYTRENSHHPDRLKALRTLPPEAKLFTAGVNSMYTNIDNNHTIYVIGEWLDIYQSQLSDYLILLAMKRTTEILLHQVLFEWGHMHFLQLLGTTMGI